MIKEAMEEKEDEREEVEVAFIYLWMNLLRMIIMSAKR
jgi:hypothetical protein